MDRAKRIRSATSRIIAAVLIMLASSLTASNCPNQNNSPQPPTIILIIDDMGNNLELGQRAIDLPGAINYAFLPHSPYTATLANNAFRQNKEILLHAPMSNLHSRPTGPGSLTPIMDQQSFIKTLREDLSSVPHARGVNNHMGSLLTQLQQPMNWLMQELKKQQLYFIDSRTSPLTVAESTAQSHQLPSLRRHVFLDNERSPEAIKRQFERLITLAKTQGSAVAIGHPYPETLKYLEQILPTLANTNISLALASEALSPLPAQQFSAHDCPNTIKLASKTTK